MVCTVQILAMLTWADVMHVITYKKCQCKAKNKNRFVCCWPTDPPKLGPTQFFFIAVVTTTKIFHFAFAVNPDLYFSGLIHILL